MRVISGKHKGRNINALKDKSANLRPTTSKTREGLFNILSHGQFNDGGKKLLEGARILDLFCGSGALAIEALSRGAAFAVFIDKDKTHLDIAQKNVKNLGEEDNASFIKANSSMPPPAYVPCNVIFIDPPYNQGLAQATLENLKISKWLAKNAILVVETSKREDLTYPEGYEELTNRNYGNSRIRILRWNGQG